MIKKPKCITGIKATTENVFRKAQTTTACEVWRSANTLSTLFSGKQIAFAALIWGRQSDNN
jgi:hypothetical protein